MACSDETSFSINPTLSPDELENYRRTRLRLEGLERWLEVGDRPPVSADRDDIDLHELEVDNIKSLRLRCDIARKASWAAMPPPPEDSHLSVAPSGICGAGLGLFTNIELETGVLICRFPGDVHNMRSAGQLVDRSYLIRVGPPVPTPWWAHAGPNEMSFEGTTPEVPFSCDETSTGCIYVDPTDTRIKARYMNDCLFETGYNVTFVSDCAGECVRVMALRNIAAGEELFVSYGSQYWETSEVCGVKVSP
jgi:hypothetical protein